MSQLVKTKRQANLKGFKRFEAFKGLVEQKNVVFNSFVCKLGLFWHSWAKKGPIYTQINYYFCSTLSEFENFLLCERILINMYHNLSKRNVMLILKI
jgi:hypothetical protein